MHMIIYAKITLLPTALDLDNRVISTHIHQQNEIIFTLFNTSTWATPSDWRHFKCSDTYKLSITIIKINLTIV